MMTPGRVRKRLSDAAKEVEELARSNSEYLNKYFTVTTKLPQADIDIILNLIEVTNARLDRVCESLIDKDFIGFVMLYDLHAPLMKISELAKTMHETNCEVYKKLKAIVPSVSEITIH